jgi:hypothetical protein
MRGRGFLGLIGLLICGSSWASGDVHGAEHTGVAPVLIILATVVLAYLIAHVFVDWIQRRFMVVSGLEYMLLGALLGPNVVTDIHVFDDLKTLAPVIAFAAGWVGLLYGMQLQHGPEGAADRSVRLGIADALGTGVAVTVAAWALFASDVLGVPTSGSDIYVAAAAMGCAAAAGSTSAVDLLRSRYPALRTNLLDVLGRTAQVGDVLAIVGFGLIFCVFHEGTVRVGTPVPSEWLIITLIVGLALGALFWGFLDDELDDNTRFLALSGIIIFASGAAFFLNLSALMVNLLLGFVIVRSRHGDDIYSTLVGTMKPIRLILLVFAGALWNPVDPVLALSLAVAYIVLRLVSKVICSWAASLGTPLRSDVFRGLFAQGNVALAMALSMQIVYDGPLIDLAYTAILISIAVHEFLAPRLLKGFLVDAGVLRQDVEPGSRSTSVSAGG